MRSAFTVVVSGGVSHNELWLRELAHALGKSRLEIWVNRKVPPNDGGISLGQAALALADLTSRANSAC